MATAGLDRMMLWTDLEGRTLHGRWRLGRLVRPEGRTAWFEATDVDGKGLMVSITEALNDEDELLERYRAAAEIRHPNVVAIRESRISHIDDTPVVVAEMETTEENLGDVLRERALNATETRQVLDAALAGLAAIHARGLVHGRMEAASVLAIGETIKLRSDCVHPGGMGFAQGVAEDVRCLGRVITQAMTRRLPSGENDALLQLLPEPMARAVRRALSGNATAAEMALMAGTRLEVVTETPREAKRTIDPYSKTARGAEKMKLVAEKGGGNRVVAMPPPVEERTETKPVAAAAAARGAMPGMLPGMLPNERESQRETRRENAREMPWESPLIPEEEKKAPRRRASAPYVVAGAVTVMLLAIFTLYGVLHREPAKAGLVKAVAHAVPAPEKVVVQPSPAATLTAAPGPGWRVVAYTYNREEAAEHKAEEVAKRDPGMAPAVFHLREGQPYLVTLGGVMSREEAIALRAKALERGFPDDTYARNYH